MVTWRGWGLLVLPIGLLPFLFSVPFVLELENRTAGGPPPSITGYFVWAPLISAAINYGFYRLLHRRRDPRQDDFMGITVKNWTPIFVVIAFVVAIAWAVEKY